MNDDHNNSSFTPLLITGEMRSGTTLVANFLNSQKDCVVYSDVLHTLFREADRLDVKNLTHKLSERERNILVSHVAAEGWSIGVEEIGEISREEIDSWMDIYRLSLEALNRNGQCRVIGTKITRVYRYAWQLLERGIKIIYCVRDPRDVLLSAKNRFSQYHLFQYADRWKQSLETGKSLAKHPNCELVLFEELLSEKMRAPILKRLSSLLGVILTDDLTALNYRKDTRFMSNTSFGDISKVFDSKAGGRWKKELDAKEVAFASSIFSKEIGELGLESHHADRGVVFKLRCKYLLYRAIKGLKDLLLATYRRIIKSMQ